MKKNITIEIYVENVKFDVFNTTHRAGLAVESANEQQYRTAAQMMASVDDTDIVQIERSIANAAARIKTELGEYLSEPAADVSTFDNDISAAVKSDTGKLVYNFTMPSNFNRNAVDALQGGIHDYIVASTIVDWFTTTNPALVQPYNVQMQTSLENAKRALYKRSRPARPARYTNGTNRPSELPGGTIDPSDIVNG